jgi:cysteine desulfuration protein SufE
MPNYPEPLNELLEDFEFVQDRSDRAELLIELADRFAEVPEEVATRPFPEEHHVQRCESDAYVWTVEQPDGTLKYHFAVENPQGISAKAMAVILDEAFSGQPLEQVAAVPCDIVYRFFGNEISMGKGQGLMGMTSMAQDEAKKRLAASRQSDGAADAGRD